MFQKVYDGFTHSQEKSEREGTSTSNSAKRVRRSGEGAKQSLPKQGMI